MFLICTYGDGCHKYKISPDQGLECTFALTENRLTERKIFKRNMRKENVKILQMGCYA